MIVGSNLINSIVGYYDSNEQYNNYYYYTVSVIDQLLRGRKQRSCISSE